MSLFCLPPPPRCCQKLASKVNIEWKQEIFFDNFFWKTLILRVSFYRSWKICEISVKHSQNIREAKNKQKNLRKIKIRKKNAKSPWNLILCEFVANLLWTFREFFTNLPRTPREQLANTSQIFRQHFATDHAKSP